MDDADTRLDGNAAAGLLGELFAVDLTAARCRCAGCGAAEQLGAEAVYASAPGTVVRCVHCGSAMAVIVHGAGRYWLGVSGMTWLEIPDPAA
jgi:Zn finger protein HypA/HybF involved in hydrogenase expression